MRRGDVPCISYHRPMDGRMQYRLEAVVRLHASLLPFFMDTRNHSRLGSPFIRSLGLRPPRIADSVRYYERFTPLSIILSRAVRMCWLSIWSAPRVARAACQ